MEQFIVDERFATGLRPLLSQLPPLVREQFTPQDNAVQRNFRLALFQALSRLDERELTVDQITAAQLPELLALAVSINPPRFQPTSLTPGKLAQEKAGSYVAGYLMTQFVDRLAKVGNPPQMVEELTVDAGDIMLAQFQRLRFNFNQRFTIANYLTDCKARTGLLTAITAKQAATLAGYDQETVHLAGQIGTSLGVAFSILNELERVQSSIVAFTTMVTAGQYPLPMLFAVEKHRDWFSQFFGQVHRPGKDQFEKARQLSVVSLEDAHEIAIELLNQAQLDIAVLPKGSQQGLSRLVNRLKQV